jgi:RNA polymerase sigma-70 factor, ECF subfamily
MPGPDGTVGVSLYHRSDGAPPHPVESGNRSRDDNLASLVPAAQAGDEDAFRMIYRSVQPGLLRYLSVLVGDDAEDVASEAWLQIVRDLASFRGDAQGLRGWTVTIARHRALDHLRARRRRPRSDMPVEYLLERAGADDTAGSALEALSTEEALALIARLPPDQAEAVLLRTVIGLDATTAAHVLGKRSGAVRTAAYRGLRRLAEHLTAEAAASATAPAPRATAAPDGVHLPAPRPWPAKSRAR